MREIPILFSAPMVRALLDGTKTQTRRVVKDQKVGERFSHMTEDGRAHIEWFGAPCCGTGVWEVPEYSAQVSCPYGQPGDRMRVKEAAWMWCERRPNGKTKTGRDKWVYVPMREAPILYAADHPKKPAIDVVSPTTGNTWGWRLKIGRFLPRWASRITLEVTGVRVERLQDISEADADSEGCERLDAERYDRDQKLCPKCGGTRLHNALGSGGGVIFDVDCLECDTYVKRYRHLWESINGPESWSANPWVWCVEFRRLP